MNHTPFLLNIAEKECFMLYCMDAVPLVRTLLVK